MSQDQTSFQHMHINELHCVLSKNSHVIVDIRDPASFQAGHITGAIHLSNESLSDFLREADYDSPVVVCCYHGNSSQQAAQFLVSQDFTEVYSLDGGFTDWQNAYPSDVAV